MKTPNPFLDAEQIRAATCVRYVELHDSLGSTNERAAELACRTNIQLPALVVARLQTAGRGRGRNTWWSTDGALTFSLLIDSATTGVLPAVWPQLSLAMAVAVCDVLVNESPQSRVGIKWPNDVLLDGGKVCGILIESPGGSAPAKGRLIIGIGINVNNSWRNAPAQAGRSGTALCDVTVRQHDLQPILHGVLTHVANRITQLRTHEMDLIEEWRRRNLLAGENVIVESDGRRIEGEVLEIAHDGALVVQTAAFGKQRLYSGSVRAD